MKSTLLTFTLISSLLVAAAATHAATYTWTGGAANEYWSSAANWQSGVAPAPNEAGVSLVFSNGVSVKAITNDVPGLQVGSLRFQGSNYVIHGKPAGKGVTIASAGFLGFAVTTGSANKRRDKLGSLVPHSEWLRPVAPDGQRRFGAAAITFTGGVADDAGFVFLEKPDGVATENAR